ncbi:MAG TPA: type II secretion system minor pseudopilin GspJ [Methylomirabilota bacterium]|nr:type II secretion system minor pseudopilin GspJ [Methylomirabilota bacterium]
MSTEDRGPSAERRAPGWRCYSALRMPHAVLARGFTLLEVLVASAILSLVLAALYGVFSQTLMSKRLVEERAARARAARIALLRLGEDLQSTLPMTTANARFTSETRLAREFPDDTLSFVTLTRTALSSRTPEGDVSEIGYALEPAPDDRNEKQLVRRVSFTLSPHHNSLDESAPLLSRVRGLRFRFFDGRNWREEWRQGEAQGQLPQAVEATVYVADSHGEVLQFSTVVDLPLAEKRRKRS